MQERLTNREKSIIPFENYVEINEKYPPELYKKLASILALKTAGFPILPGFVVSGLDKDSMDTISAWASKFGSKRVSLRFDSPKVADQIKLSSLNPLLDELKKMSLTIMPPVIGLILAENDRYKQSHSILAQFLGDRIICDIVGPGFDAGDLTRGNVTPHETIEIVHKDLSNEHGDLTTLDILSHRIATPENYQKSRELRFGLIHATMNKDLGKSVEPKNINIRDKKLVVEFLARRGASIPDTYDLLGWERLSKLYSYLLPLDMYREYYKNQFGININQKVISASFLMKHGLVFWDLYDGKKYKSG